MRLDEKADARWTMRVVGMATLVVAVLYLVLAWVGHALRPLQALRDSVECRRNLHIITRAFGLYSDDYEARYPPAAQWQHGLVPYVEEKYRRCPACPSDDPAVWGYAMNKAASGADRELVERPEQLALSFDSDRIETNAHDDPGNLPRPGRHVIRRRGADTYTRGNWVGYADGSARFTPDGRPDRSGGGSTSEEASP